MRAFYSLLLAAWDLPTAEPATRRSATRPGQCVECGRSLKTAYLFSAVDPNQAICDAGGKRLGGRLSELTSAAAKHFTMTRVRRAEGKLAATECAVRTTDVLDGDTVLEGPPLLRTIFAGDDPATLL